MTPTPEQLQAWRVKFESRYDPSQLNRWMADPQNYKKTDVDDAWSVYVEAREDALADMLEQPEGEPPQNKENLDDLLGKYWDIAHSEGSTGVSRGDEAGAVLSSIQSLLDQPSNEPAARRIDELEAQLAALTHAIVERDLIIGQYIAEVDPPIAGEAI